MISDVAIFSCVYLLSLYIFDVVGIVQVFGTLFNEVVFLLFLLFFFNKNIFLIDFASYEMRST